MARKPRIEFDGALYHVIARGNRKENIFRNKGDYEKYLALLSRYKERYHYRLFSFVLMPNHLHLLMETSDVHLSKIMQGLQQSYTAYFNRKYEAAGHLFQGRYKAILCDRDSYLLTLIKYIHLNPIRARIVKKPFEYLWSSHHAYLSKKQSSDLADTDFVLDLLNSKRSLAIKHYQDFMNNTICADREEIYGTIDQRFLGDERFVEEIANRTKSNIRDKRKPHKYSLRQIMAAVEGITHIGAEEMRSKSKSRVTSRARTALCRVARYFSYKVTEIAEFLGKEPSAISRYHIDERSVEDDACRVIEALSSNVNNQA